MLDKTKEVLDGAIATTRGWLHKETGELLVSIHGLSGAVEWTKELVESIKNKTVAVAKKVEAKIVEEEPKVVAEVKKIDEKIEELAVEALDKIEAADAAVDAEVVKVAEKIKAAVTPAAPVEAPVATPDAVTKPE